MNRFEYSFEYKGEIYYSGTKVKIKAMWGEPCIMVFRDRYTNDFGEEILNFVGNYNYSVHQKSVEKYVLEIVELPTIEEIEKNRNQRIKPPDWDVEVGWVWYIIIMVVGTLFKQRLLVYIFATAIFFLWKNGFLNNNK